MAQLYLELYKGHLVSPTFGSLPGADKYVGSAVDYYAILTDTPPSGSPAAAFLAPAPPDSDVGAATHGTDTLPAGTSNFIPTQIGIWGPKYPPYKFEVISPAGDTIILDPPSGSDPFTWLWLPVPQSDGMGIWRIRVTPISAVELPKSINGRHAHLNPHDVNFDAANFAHQPLLGVKGPDDQPSTCAEITGIQVTGCAPGTVTFHANIALPSEVEEITWDFGDGTPEQLGTEDESHDYVPLLPGGEYHVTVTILRHQGCVPRTQTDSAVVEPCPSDCPELMIDNILIEVAGQCNQDGTRDVSMEPVLNPNATPVANLRWEFSDGSDPVTIGAGGDPAYTLPFSAPGTGESELTVTLVVTREDNCSDTFSRTVPIPGCEADCPTLGKVTADTGFCVNYDKRRVTLDAEINGGGVTQFIWDFGDGQGESLDASTAGTPRTTHDYDAPGTYQAKLTIVGPGDCRDESDPITVKVAACRPGIPGCTDPNAINYNPHATVDDGSCRYEPNGPPRNGGDGLCCALIYVWLVTFVLIWFTIVYLPALLIALAISLTALVAWFLICHDCGWKFWTRKFLKCINPFTNCCFLRWTILGHEIALFLVGWAITIGIYTAPPWIWGALTGGLALWSGLWSRARCKSYPIIFRPSTWPPCRCKR